MGKSEDRSSLTGYRFTDRPVGLSSRVRRDTGRPQQTWTSPCGVTLTLPMIVDLVCMGPSNRRHWSAEARVGLVDGRPELLAMLLETGNDAPAGLEVEQLQVNFRWNTPLEIVTRMVPRIIARGGDPYEFEFPSEGFPGVSQPRPGHRLTEEFLTDIARDYLTAEAPYATTMAQRYNVSPRTVVSWIEKARQRGVLTGSRRASADLTPFPDTEREPC